MLNCFLDDYLRYCKTLGLANTSHKELISYVNQFNTFLINNELSSVGQLQYKHLFNFAISGQAAPTTIKARIWALKKFFAFLELHGHIKDNIAKGLNPPKIPKKETRFLTEAELRVVFIGLSENSHTANGLKDFALISLMAITGLRKGSVVALDLEDFDEACNTLGVQEKGLFGKRVISVPSSISILLSEHIYRAGINEGPLFLNSKKKRLAGDGVNKIVNKLKKRLIVKGHHFAETLHPHIFRHSAGTQLNEVASFTVTKEMLGHKNSQNTRKYIHLSPTSYGGYMKRHPYFGKAQQNYFLSKQGALI